MGASLVGTVIGATLAGTILCVALFFALKCLRRRRREVMDEETCSISSQSTESTEDESPKTPEEGVVDHLAICRRVVPCFASAEYEGPSIRAGSLDNLRRSSAQDLERAGYESIATTGEPENTPDQTLLHNDYPQAGNRQAQSTGEESIETSHPAPTFIDRSSLSVQPGRFYSRPTLERAGPLSRVADHPRTKRFRPESYDRTIRHRSWTPDHIAQSKRAVAEPRHESSHSWKVNLTLPEIRRLPTLRMPDRSWCEEDKVKER